MKYENDFDEPICITMSACNVFVRESEPKQNKEIICEILGLTRSSCITHTAGWKEIL